MNDGVRHGKILVHIETAHPHCYQVEILDIRGVPIPEIAEDVMNTYNKEFNLDYKIGDAAILYSDDFCTKMSKGDTENDLAILEFATEFENFEIFVQFKDVVEKSVACYIPEEIQSKYLEMAKEFSDIGDYHSALMFLRYTGSRGKDELIKIYKDTDRNDEVKKILSNSIYPIHYDISYQNEMYTPMPSDEEITPLKVRKMINELNNLPYNEERTKHHISAIMKVSEQIALETVLQNPKFYSCLPLVCESEEGFQLFLKYLDQYHIDNKMRIRFAELFIGEGHNDRGIAIGYNAKILNDADPDEVRRGCWLMLNDRRFPDLYAVLVGFYKKYCTKKLARVSLTLIYNYLLRSKKCHGEKIRSREILIPCEPFDAADIDFVAILLITGIFFFVNGDLIDFSECFMACMNIINPTYFKFIGKNFPEYHLFAICVDKLRDAINDRSVISSLYSVGDQFSLGNAFNIVAEFDMVVPSPIFGITIWDLRSTVSNFNKTAFFNRVAEAPCHEGIMISLGENDVTHTIPMLLRNGHFDSVFSSIDCVVKIFIQVINHIKFQFPQLEIRIHPIDVTDKSLEPIQLYFTSAISSMLPDGVIMLKDEDLRDNSPVNSDDNSDDSDLQLM